MSSHRLNLLDNGCIKCDCGWVVLANRMPSRLLGRLLMEHSLQGRTPNKVTKLATSRDPSPRAHYTIYEDGEMVKHDFI